MTTTKGKKRVTFVLDEPSASQVTVCGDFNNWEIARHPMKQDEEGFWRKIVMLSPGRYEYKLYVDDQWRCDPANTSKCANQFGTSNSVIIVD